MIVPAAFVSVTVAGAAPTFELEPILIALSAVASLTTIFFPPETSIVPVAPETFTSVVDAASTAALVALVTFKVFNPVILEPDTSESIANEDSKLIVSIPEIVAVISPIAISLLTFNVSKPSPPFKVSIPVKEVLAAEKVSIS